MTDRSKAPIKQINQGSIAKTDIVMSVITNLFKTFKTIRINLKMLYSTLKSSKVRFFP